MTANQINSIINADTLTVFQIKDNYTGNYRYVIAYSFNNEWLGKTEKVVGRQSLCDQFVGHVEIRI